MNIDPAIARTLSIALLVPSIGAALVACRPTGSGAEPAAQPPPPAPVSAQGAVRSFDLGKGAAIEMVRVEPGTFTMGSTNGRALEQPIHRVTITKAYYLGKYEVTQGQWKAVMGKNPSEFTANDDLPVEQVSWEDCQEFVQKLTERAGGGWRLPTEAEWEYACRAGTTGDHAGDLDAMAWYVGSAGDKTHPVGQKQPNAWSLYDMHGNVSEWCADWFGWYTSEDQADPRGTRSDLVLRIARGGHWDSPAANCRSAGRDRTPPSFRIVTHGVRLARTPE